MSEPTTYVVLRLLPVDVARNHNAWIVEHSNVQATSAQGAIRTAYPPHDPETTVDLSGPTKYVAIPARSWNPVTVTREITTTLKLENSEPS